MPYLWGLTPHCHVAIPSSQGLTEVSPSQLSDNEIEFLPFLAVLQVALDLNRVSSYTKCRLIKS